MQCNAINNLKEYKTRDVFSPSSFDMTLLRKHY